MRMHLYFKTDIYNLPHLTHNLEQSIAGLLELTRGSITGAAPFGENINYDPEFDRLKAEVGKVGTIDFSLVESLARSILLDKSKDIRVILFLSYAILRNEQWDDLADLYEGLAELSMPETYARLHPERQRAKELAFKWLSEQRFMDLLAQKKPDSGSHDSIVRLVDALERLKVNLEEAYPEGSPFPAGFLSVALSWKDGSRPKPVPVANEQAASVSAVPESPRDAQVAGRKAALTLIEMEPQKPMGYRLLRTARFDLLEKAPPTANGTTQLPGPPPQQQDVLAGLCDKQNWAKLLSSAQQAFTAGANHLWLDLQRYSYAAAGNLGDAYEPVRDAILFETAYLVKRIPGIVALSFADGTPFADGATREWIHNAVGALFAGKNNRAESQSQTVSDRLGQERQMLVELTGAQRFEEALGFVQQAIASSSHESDNLRRKVMLAELMVNAKRPEMAVALLESVDSLIETYDLARWNPELCAETWTVLTTALRAATGGKSQQQQGQLNEKRLSILGKLTRVDPKRAFSLYN